MEIKNTELFEEVSPNRWRLPKNRGHNLRADVEIFADQEILETAVSDLSIQQAVNVAQLPGVVSASIAMPDIHYGYGFCIGGVAAFPAETGVVSPGGVGYDINCGVRLVSTQITVPDMLEQREALGYAILRDIPTGLTDRGNHKFSPKEFMNILSGGAEAVCKQFGGDPNDLRFIESGGKLEFHSPESVSDRAVERGKTQVGSLGGGNHFIELQAVDEIYDPRAAAAFGLKKGFAALMIHTGSRGFGHQIASDYIEKLRKTGLEKLDRLKIRDPQLIFADIQSKEGQGYLRALNAASNFAWANRHLLMLDIIRILERFFHASARDLGIRLIYDQAHNIAKFETHTINNRPEKLLVHRKGSTRAFPAGHPDIPAEYRAIGQPVLIPGSMGTASYVLKGAEEAMTSTFGTSAHGAGRRLSRHQAIKAASAYNVQERLREKNILVFSHSAKGLKEEVPEAYKEIDGVIAVTERTGISQKVARMVPLAVIKG